MNNPQKVVKKSGIFQCEVDVIVTMWHTYSPLNIVLAANTFREFKGRLPIILGNGVNSTNEHMATFSNACDNIDAHDNDTWIILFVNSFEGRVATKFFYLPNKIVSTWFELIY
jgi:hypothetical protein